MLPEESAIAYNRSGRPLDKSIYYQQEPRPQER